jgi:tetratricopeptide (TPR) repeat protein
LTRYFPISSNDVMTLTVIPLKNANRIRIDWPLACLFIMCLVLISGCGSRSIQPPPGTPNMVGTWPKTPPPGRKDPLQVAYEDFALASLALLNGEDEVARAYLAQAIEKDPESVFLNLKMAEVLKKLKDYREAIPYALKAVSLAPDRALHHALLADLYALAGDDDRAVESYEEALALEPENQRVRLVLTTILIRKSEFGKAMTHLDWLIDKNPELVVAQYYKGRINMETGQYAAAEESYRRALALNNRLEPALFDLGTLYQMTGKLHEAEETYDRLLEFYPDNIGVRERLIDLYTKLNQPEKAEKQLEEIKRYSRPGEPGRQALGLIYLKQGKLDESIEELKLIVSAWPDDDKSRYYLATAYAQKGETDEALDHFSRVRPQSKYYVNARMHMAYLLETQEKHAEAIKILEELIVAKEKRPEIYLMLASVYEAMKDYDKAMAVVKEGLEQDSRNVDLIFRLGVILDKKGDKAGCIQQMRSILEIEPDHAEALNYIGYTYAEQGVRLDEALSLVEKAAKLRPDSGYIADSLGWVYFQKGQYDDAIRYLEKATMLTPDDPTINEHLGDAYFKKERYEESLERYKKALSLNHPEKEKVMEKVKEVERRLMKRQ